MVKITPIHFVIFDAMIVYGSYLDASCAICLDTPNRVLKPCGHVLCEEDASQILSSGCPLCREQITHLQPLSPEETRVVQSLRAESDYRDELLRKKRIDGDSDLIVEKFCLQWKKDKHLIEVELMKRIAVMNLENSKTFQEALKQTMRDGHRILMQKKEKEKERHLIYWNDFEQRSKNMSKGFFGQCPHAEALVALIPKEKERKRARELTVSEVIQRFKDLENMIQNGQVELNGLEDQNNVVRQHFMKCYLDVETKIYEKFLKGKRLSAKNSQILEDLRKDTEEEYLKLERWISSANSTNWRAEDGCIEFIKSAIVETDDDCLGLETIENKPATGLCNRVCESIMRTFCNSRAKLD